ncbi:HNH endonuclease [Streptomyces sp. NPDC056291]|uniref:HNH endonuclease n=1 Tax=Streptomyces sp. NPDC056291 TaxID=3345772 RepID=UPI0035DD91CE
MVYAAFHDVIPTGLAVRHRDGDPTNNRLSNLELGTQSDNMHDAVRHGTVSPPKVSGEANGAARLTSHQVSEIRSLYAVGDVSQRALGDRFGVSRSLISYIVRGKLWRASE